MCLVEHAHIRIHVLCMTRTKKEKKNTPSDQGNSEWDCWNECNKKWKIFVIPVKMLLHFWAIPFSPFAFVYLCLYGTVDSFFFSHSARAHFPVFLQMLCFRLFCSIEKQKLLCYKCFSYMIFVRFLESVDSVTFSICCWAFFSKFRFFFLFIFMTCILHSFFLYAVRVEEMLKKLCKYFEKGYIYKYYKLLTKLVCVFSYWPTSIKRQKKI